MRALATGFLTSALIHLALVAAVLALFALRPKSEVEPENVPLRLSMFSALPNATPSLLPESPAPVQEEHSSNERTPEKHDPESAPSPHGAPAAASSETSASAPIPAEESDSGMSVRWAAVDAEPDIDMEALEESYRELLRNAIAANLSYPEKARRLMQEGRVQVSFTMVADGTVRNAHVVKSSGSPILDRAAMDLVTRLSGRFPLPEELAREEWELSLPVEYRLK